MPTSPSTAIPRRTGIVALAGLIALTGIVLVATPAHAQEWQASDLVPSWAEARFRNGVLVMPNFGGGLTDENDLARGFRPGARMGIIAGWHLTPGLSLNGEVDLNVILGSGDGTVSGSNQDPVGFHVEYAFAPLLHVGAPQAELVLGPKVGRFHYSASEGSIPSASGWSYGANIGFLTPLDSMAVGALFSYTADHATEICAQTCHARDSSAEDFHIFALSFALLY